MPRKKSTAKPAPKKKVASSRKKGGSPAKPRPRSRRANGRAEGEGCTAAIVISEQAGTGREDLFGAVRSGATPPKLRANALKQAISVKHARAGVAMCRVLAAAGHTTRMKILLKLLDGPATYRAVQRVTKTPAGPLYHHINQLRLAGLILPKQRDLYELTRGGRNLVLGVAAMAPLVKDRRRRPVA